MRRSHLRGLDSGKCLLISQYANSLINPYDIGWICWCLLFRQAIAAFALSGTGINGLRWKFKSTIRPSHDRALIRKRNPPQPSCQFNFHWHDFSCMPYRCISTTICSKLGVHGHCAFDSNGPWITFFSNIPIEGVLPSLDVTAMVMAGLGILNGEILCGLTLAYMQGKCNSSL